MTSGRIYLAALLAATTIATPAWAQTSTSTSGSSSTGSTSSSSSTTVTSSNTSTSSTTGSFQSLSPGQQKIARALFEAQQPSASGRAPLSLDQIAARKEGTGWGEVFKQMKSEGLVGDAKNLGQVVSGRASKNGSTITTASSGSTGTAVTTASGRSVGSGKFPTSTGSGGEGHGGSAHVSDVKVTTAAGSAGSHGGGAGNAHAH
jgi:hypothetical protein